MSDVDRERTALMLVDHGSRRKESNDMLFVVADMVKKSLGYPVVEAAHMELADPDIPTSFAKCVEQGAETIVVHPYFLFPGRHWSEDIPKLVGEAAKPFPEIKYLVSSPLGAHPLMMQIIDDRVQNCLSSAEGHSIDCQFCESGKQCSWRAGR